MKKRYIKIGIISLTLMLGINSIGSWVKADDNTPVNSNATVYVENGFLTLNRVPDLNFGVTYKAPSGQTLGLLDNNTGNQQNEISVIDSRTTDKADGWQLKATLGKFVNEDTKKTSDEIWQLSLRENNYTNSSHSSVFVNPNATLTSGDETTGAGINVITAPKGHGLGRTTVNYNQSGYHTATLMVPKETEKGHYTAPITWTLTAGIEKSPTA